MGAGRPHIVTAKMTDKPLKEPLRNSGNAGSERVTSVSWQACVLVILFLVVFFESRAPMRKDVELMNGYIGVLYREALGCLTSNLSADKIPKYEANTSLLTFCGVGGRGRKAKGRGRSAVHGGRPSDAPHPVPAI